MALKDWFRILNRRWECLLMMGKERGRQGGRRGADGRSRTQAPHRGPRAWSVPSWAFGEWGGTLMWARVSAQDCECKKTP